jgi:hypothetical protein
MLFTIVATLLSLWLLGFSLNVGGGLIHLLLVVGLVILIVNFRRDVEPCELQRSRHPSPKRPSVP